MRQWRDGWTRNDKTDMAGGGGWQRVRVMGDQLGLYFWHAKMSRDRTGMPFPWCQHLDTHQLNQSTNQSRPHAIIPDRLKNLWQLLVTRDQYLMTEILRCKRRYAGTTMLNKIQAGAVTKYSADVFFRSLDIFWRDISNWHTKMCAIMIRIKATTVVIVLN